MRDKAAKILRKALEKAGKEELVKALDNVLAKNKMEEETPKVTKQDLVNHALEKQAEAIDAGKYYDKHAVARIEAGDAKFIESYTNSFLDSKKESK